MNGDAAVLAGKRVAMFVEDGFEDRELTGPLQALRAAGAAVTLVGPTAGAEFRGKRGEAAVTSELAAGAPQPGAPVGVPGDGARLHSSRNLLSSRCSSHSRRGSPRNNHGDDRMPAPPIPWLQPSSTQGYTLRNLL